MRFGILGPLVVETDEGVVPVSARKERALLEALALRAGRVVSVSELVNALWGENPPPSAGKTLQTYISNLRKRIGDPPLATQAPGYSLQVPTDDIDALRFEALAVSGRDELTTGDPRHASTILAEALDLWRGDPLLDVDTNARMTADAIRLAELRRAVLEDRIEADLALGHHDTAVPELEALVVEYPYRERFWQQLVVALYRSGRQADALRAFRSARERLVEELGVEPGHALREVERMVLGQDPALDAEPPSSPRRRSHACRDQRSAGEETGENLPSGTVTFLFTDIEGSTRQWQEDPSMPNALVRHDEIVRAAVEANSGRVLKHTGDGVLAVFHTADTAVDAAVDAQRMLHETEWAGKPVRVRMAVHTGGAEERDGDYFGPTVNLASRLMSVGHGGQILVSCSTAELLRHRIRMTDLLTDLGEHRLESLDRPERIFQVVSEGLRSKFPPLRTAREPPSNLPDPRTSLIGREDDVGHLVRLFDTHRLVTLTGPGGSGKTRLALEVAGRLSERFNTQMACWCDLSLLSTSEPLVHAVARAAGVNLRRPALVSGVNPDAVQDLLQHLSGRELLLVLDNCEHVVDACSHLVAALLDGCEGIHVLATSREPLRVRGEQLFPVGTLQPPADDEDVGCDAVRLFVERAVEARPDFVITDVNRRPVVEICRRLDGLPLALELAAARVSHVSPSEILERLDHLFQFLRSREVNRPDRHRTLRAMLDWSYDLLDDDQRRLFRRLAVFAGPFDLEALHAVCKPQPAAKDPTDLVSDLVDKSLVVAEHRERVTHFRLLEAVRAYARTHLVASDDHDETLDAHAAWYLSCIEDHPWDERTLSPATAAEFEEQYGDLRQALVWCERCGRTDLLARFAASLVGMFVIRGYFEEADRWFAKAIEHEQTLPESQRVATALWFFTTLFRWNGEVSTLRSHRERLAPLAESFPPGSFIKSLAYATLASMCARMRHERNAWERYAELALTQSPESPRLMAMASCQRARSLLARGAHHDAVSLLESALRTEKSVDGDSSYSVAEDLALALHLAGDHGRVLTLPMRSELEEPLFVRPMAIYCGLSAAALDEGDHARDLLRDAASTVSRDGSHRSTAVNDLRLAIGALAAIEGRLDDAARHLAGLAPSSMSINALDVLLAHYQARVRAAVGPARWAELKSEGSVPDVASAFRDELGAIV